MRGFGASRVFATPPDQRPELGVSSLPASSHYAPRAPNEASSMQAGPFHGQSCLLGQVWPYLTLEARSAA